MAKSSFICHTFDQPSLNSSKKNAKPRPQFWDGSSSPLSSIRKNLHKRYVFPNGISEKAICTNGWKLFPLSNVGLFRANKLNEQSYMDGDCTVYHICGQISRHKPT